MPILKFVTWIIEILCLKEMLLIVYQRQRLFLFAAILRQYWFCGFADHKNIVNPETTILFNILPTAKTLFLWHNTCALSQSHIHNIGINCCQYWYMYIVKVYCYLFYYIFQRQRYKYSVSLSGALSEKTFYSASIFPIRKTLILMKIL